LRGGFGQAGSFGHRAATSTPKMLGGPSASSKTRPILAGITRVCGHVAGRHRAPQALARQSGDTRS
jgi:hypothetical protein